MLFYRYKLINYCLFDGEKVRQKYSARNRTNVVVLCVLSLICELEIGSELNIRASKWSGKRVLFLLFFDI